MPYKVAPVSQYMLAAKATGQPRLRGHTHFIHNESSSVPMFALDKFVGLLSIPR